MDSEQIKKIIKESVSQAKKGRFKRREVNNLAIKYLHLKQILSIVGVRRSGKSTLMKLLIRKVLRKTAENNVLYLNLEHPFFNQYKDDVNNLQKIYDIFRKNSTGKTYLFLDEIQFFKDWQVFVKHVYEKGESKIIITGLNSRLLSSELATLLSGRSVSLHMYPFSRKESELSLKQYLSVGGFPEIVLSRSSAKILAETYYKNILYQDVIPRFGISNSMAMENLSYYLLSNIGKEISFNKLKNIVNLDDKTVKQYTLYLEDANLLYLVYNYDFSLKKMIGNKKKIYFVDPVFSKLSFRNSPDIGRLYENHVYLHLKRMGFDIYFFKNSAECDFIIKKGLKIVCALQVCYRLTKENEKREITGLLSAMEKFNLKEGYIVTAKQLGIRIKEGEKIKVIDAKSLEKFGIDSEFY